MVLATARAAFGSVVDWMIQCIVRKLESDTLVFSTSSVHKQRKPICLVAATLYCFARGHVSVTMSEGASNGEFRQELAAASCCRHCNKSDVADEWGPRLMLLCSTCLLRGVHVVRIFLCRLHRSLHAPRGAPPKGLACVTSDRLRELI